MKATARDYRVELSICIGSSQPIPIPGFPKLPTYAFWTLGPAESKRDAGRRAKLLSALNPGYQFVVSAAKPEVGNA